jgi:wyosine [tRNA(Phe)-imidazoG37] synthetase (radical SAM superfamily)
MFCSSVQSSNKRQKPKIKGSPSFFFQFFFRTFAAVMSTIIYPSPVFGPVQSRRLGISLGINLLPADGKVCSFDCIYCECGFNADHRPRLPLPTRQEVAERLELKLQQMAEDGQMPDVLTFAGNGEPTCHPHFAEIIGDTIALRDRYCPKAKVSVLSNSTMIHRQEVHDALMRVDNNILKLDTVDPYFISRVDRPAGTYDVAAIVERMKAFRGHVIIQTMFLSGPGLDNTTPYYVDPWLKAVVDIAPEQVMIYTIDRETPDRSLCKASRLQLDAIRDQVVARGIACTASY